MAAAEKKILVTSYTRMIDCIESRAEKLLIYVRDFDSEKQDKSFLEDKLESVEEMRSLFHETEVKLYGVIKEDEVASFQMDSEKLEDMFDEIRHLARSKLREIEPPKPITEQVKVSSVQGTHSKLPDIPLPRFTGQLEDWQSFKSQFSALIKRREGLTDSEKLFYLKAALQEGAARYIQSPEDTFSSLWKALNSEFENKRLLVDKHIAQLFHLKPIVRESGSALRSMINDVTRCIRALANLELKVEKLSEQFLIHLVCARLDSRTRKDFELQLTDTSLPSWEKLFDFLQSRCRCLESIEQEVKDQPITRAKGGPQDRSVPNQSKALAISTAPLKPNYSHIKCFECQGPHFLNRCDTFLALPTSDRYDRIKKWSLCLNCLSNKHLVSKCKSSSCRKCGRRHHTLLHTDSSTPASSSSNQSESKAVEPKSTDQDTIPRATSSTNSFVGSVSSTSQANQYVLYTAVGLVEDDYGNSIQCRVLLDCGSMRNLITTRIVNMLKLPMAKANVSVTGISGTPQLIKSMVAATIRSTVNPHASFKLEFLAMKSITTEIPVQSFDIDPERFPTDTKLADPAFNRSRRIDMLLGIEVFNELFTGKSFSLADDRTLWCKETIFGWVVGGAVAGQSSNVTTTNMSKVVTNEMLSEQISRFWESEAIPEPRALTSDEQAAEQSFLDTFRRLEDGRYEVGLPVKPSIRELGDSQAMATSRFVQTERGLLHRQDVREQYLAFMREYEDQGHMHKVDQICQDGYVMPHHAVFNPASTTTKTRVVFDASARTSTGSSLNDHLYVGTVLQRKLTDIVLRFRVPRIVFTADMIKMFRQIRIRTEDQKYQQIFWRSEPDAILDIYHLATVTYGTACAPFLSTRTLEQLCKDELERFPLASKAGTSDVYMDDLLSGADSIDDALALQKEFVEMMSSAGFTLHKWASNHPDLLKSVPNADAEQAAFFEDEKTTRTLGLTWQPHSDVYLTKLHEIQFYCGPPTKRSVYSDIAKQYDPLGFLGPVIFMEKVYMQKLWQLEVEWDDVLAESEADTWLSIRNQLAEMGEISIPRLVIPHPSPLQVELHGFCDASMLGFGAVVYVRCVYSNEYTVTLLTSKSRIAPNKNAKLTIPRLELCGALVLARLICSLTQILSIPISRTILWSDSTTVLSWIRTDPSKLKPYVSNRTIKIQNLAKDIEWRHVGTHDNPADVLSRGLRPDEIRACALWWSGPTFLHHDESAWPAQPMHTPAEQLPETKNLSVNLTVTDPPVPFKLFTTVSKFRKMQRVMAFMLRFIDHIRKGDRRDHRFGDLTIRELTQATSAMISICQHEAFPDEIRRLQTEKVIHSKSQLISFSVFLDVSTRFPVLRVGGRIRHSKLPMEQKHPMVLPSGHPLTATLIRSYHHELLHAPPQLLLNALRRRFWVLRGRSTVRKIIRRCVTCFRAKPVTMQQKMGDLPKDRLDGVYPFLNTGVDFCGPIYIRQHNKRSTVKYKAYVAVFVCFATRAIHLELVGDLTADAFIAALHRFVARRGICAKMFSDNGLNFVGSRNKLKELYDLFKSQLLKSMLDDFCTKKAIEWHLIPPNAPHFGGLWEAGVRSAKYHLKRITGTANLNFEEYTTVLCRIEAVLNSRPITPLSDDPNDICPLTPGHFLVQRPLTDIAEPDLSSRKESTLSRWQRLTQMVQHFWARWYQDYITTLQNRNKWHKERPISPGQMVIIREDNMPTMLWRTGRIEDAIPGPDGLVRVANVRTSSKKVTQRPITKLCLLPIEDNDDPRPDEPNPHDDSNGEMD